MTNRRFRIRGFTLVQLLAVIAIIGMLAALLLPVFARSLDKAHQIDCVGNLSQIGKAFILYASDSDERLPDQLAGRTSTNPNVALSTDFEIYLWPYTRGQQIFRCPSDILSKPVILPKVTLFNSYATAWNVQGKALSQIPASALTVLEGENIQTSGPIDFNWLIQELGKTSFTPPEGIIFVQPDFRHNQMGNYLFVDGHVKSLHGPNPGFPGYKTSPDGVALCGENDPLPQ